MYQVKRENKKLTKVEFSENFSFFPMASNKKVFVIEKTNIKNIMIINHKLAHPLVAKKVQKEYEKLVITLMDLLTSDDDTGESFREALNRIEKFRQEIKNKYRDFLKKQELEDMAKQLKVFQQESQKRYYELQTAIYEMSLQQGKGK
mgnify:FL=1